MSGAVRVWLMWMWIAIEVFVGSTAFASSVNDIETENARIYLDELPIVEKKILQSKFEKIQFATRQMVQLFSPDNSDEDSDPVIVLVQGNPDAPHGAFPELTIALHRLMKAHFGVYYYKGNNGDSATPSGRNADILKASIQKIARDYPEKELIIIGYSTGRTLLGQLKTFLSANPKFKVYAAFLPDILGVVPTLERLVPLARPGADDRATWRCCLSQCAGGPSAKVFDLEIGYFQAPINTVNKIQYRGFVNAFGSAPGRMGMDRWRMTRSEPWKDDENYLYFTIARDSLNDNLLAQEAFGFPGDHLISINSSSPSEGYLWLNYFSENKTKGGKISAPIPLRCAHIGGRS